MIKLSKGPEPDVLIRNRARWTQELLSAIAAGDMDLATKTTKKYNHPDVKDALKVETNGKCAYCDAKVTDVSHGDIEHVTPKSNARERTFDWDNLTFACQICNQYKSNKLGILDPYNEDPNENIFFAAAFLKGRTHLGQVTVLELKLNRPSLIEGRNREIERYANEIEKIFLLGDDRTRTLMLNGLVEDLGTRKPEFVATCLSIISHYFDI